MDRDISSIARKYYEVLWSKPDLDLADEMIDTSYKPDWISIDKSGAEQIKHEINFFRSAFPDLVYTIVDLVETENKVWMRYKGNATQSGVAWGFPATNKEVEFEGVTILYFNDIGKIIGRWGSFCFYDMLVDLGHVPPFWELPQLLNKNQ